MRKSGLLIATLLLGQQAMAGLVEINSSNFIRESGSPVTESTAITLENAGEIRVYNTNLQDGAVEVSESTEVILDGQPLLSPFQLPTGGSVVYPLSPGEHTLDVTLYGKPGGGVTVAFYENKPDAPEAGVGFEVLADGTVLHKKTGLIWHRLPNSPGLPEALRDSGGPIATWTEEKVGSYFDDLNAGTYGTDSVDGNAGQTDWRLPSFEELVSLMDLRFGDECRYFYDEAAHKCLEWYRLADASGNLPYNTFGQPWMLDEGWDERERRFWACPHHLSSDVSRKAVLEGAYLPHVVGFVSYVVVADQRTHGCIWPVRGEMRQ